jgi:hypothetical protein
MHIYLYYMHIKDYHTHSEKYILKGKSYERPENLIVDS